MYKHSAEERVPMPTEILSPSSKAMALFVETTLWDEMAPEPDPTPYQQMCQQLAQDRLWA